MAIFAQNLTPTTLLLRGGYIEIQPGASRETLKAELDSGVYADAVLQGLVKIVEADSTPDVLVFDKPEAPVPSKTGAMYGQVENAGGMTEEQYKAFLAGKSGKLGVVPGAASAETPAVDTGAAEAASVETAEETPAPAAKRSRAAKA